MQRRFTSIPIGAGKALVSFADAIAQFHRLAMRGMKVGFCPCRFAFAHRFPIGQTLVDDKPFQRRQPMLVVVRAIIRLTAIIGGLQLIGQRSGPFLPGEMAVLGEFDGERKRLRLPRFRVRARRPPAPNFASSLRHLQRLWKLGNRVGWCPSDPPFSSNRSLQN